MRYTPDIDSCRFGARDSEFGPAGAQPSSQMDSLNEDARIALQPVLEPREEIAGVLPAIGCKLVLTDRHLVLVRDGRTFRPRSGIQVWPLDSTLCIRATPTGSQPGRVLISSGRRTTSIFVAAEYHHAADQLVADARRRIHARS